MDTIKMLPFLLFAYLLIEWLEHRATDRVTERLGRAGRLGGPVGALLGCIPQCGFSVAAVKFWNAGVITSGTLIAVLLSTSDEALPVLLASPGAAGEVWKLIACKLVSACVAGLLVDMLWKEPPPAPKAKNHKHGDDCHCECDGHVLGPALRHTVQTGLFLFAVTLAIGAALELIGDEALAGLLLRDTVWQPFLSALFGLVPNCGVSVVLTKLYLEGGLSFGGALAGLCSGAGVGLAVLYRSRDRRRMLTLCAILYLSAVLAGLAANVIL